MLSFPAVRQPPCRPVPWAPWPRAALSFSFHSGSRLLSRIVSNTVPSAAQALTVVFGMGTGVPPERIATGSSESFCSSVPRPQGFLPPCRRVPASPLQLNNGMAPTRFLRKEVIQPHLPIRLPCYDFTPVTGPAFGCPSPSGFGHRLRAFPAPMV